MVATASRPDMIGKLLPASFGNPTSAENIAQPRSAVFTVNHFSTTDYCLSNRQHSRRSAMPTALLSNAHTFIKATQPTVPARSYQTKLLCPAIRPSTETRQPSTTRVSPPSRTTLPSNRRYLPYYPCSIPAAEIARHAFTASGVVDS